MRSSPIGSVSSRRSAGQSKPLHKSPPMRFLATLFRNLSRHGAVERNLDEEVHAHLELLVDKHRATGMEDAAARRAARLELGGTGQAKDAVRDVRPGIWLAHFWQDLRYALRIF